MTADLPRDRDAAVEALFRVHAGSLLQVAVLLVGDEAAAQEVVLDAFADLRVGRRYQDDFEAIDTLRAAVVRGARRRPPDPEGVLAPLTQRQREVFLLRWWLGLSDAETGELLRLSPKVVSRALTEARSLLPPEEELVEETENQALAAQLSYDAMDQLRDRISVTGSRRHRRIGAQAAAAVLVVVAVAAALWATRPRPYVSPTGRPTFAAVVPAAEFATFDVATGRPKGAARLSSAEAVTSLPAGGWLVSRTQPGCASALVTVHPDGTTTGSGATYSDLLSGIEVSPDGRYVAAVVSDCSAAGVLEVDVIDLRTWRVQDAWAPPPGTTSITGLSWAPDSRRLSYTLGTGVGGGGSGYALLDTRQTKAQLARTSPLAREIDVDGRGCQVVRSLWLGGTGRFAVFASCLDRNELLLVSVPPQPAAVQRGRVLATLPGSALTLGIDAAVTDDGRHLLVTTDVATYRVDGSRVTRLVDARPSPAW